MKEALIVEDIIETGVWFSSILGIAFPDIQITICRNCHLTHIYLKDNQPDLALVDINLPDGSGLNLIPAILIASPQVSIVVTTILDDQEHILTALQMGASGYLLKDLADDVFIKKLRGILQGDPPLSPKVARKILQHFNSGTSVSTRISMTTPVSADSSSTALSSRETEVLILVGKGLSRREVAAALHLSEHTIATHVRHVYRKLNISSRAEAALEACRMGLINTEL